jgi:AAA15 family ATPase/GTPase
MENFSCKILSLQFQHLKNTNLGKIDFLSEEEFLSGEHDGKGVYGIYGQNGSGKSTAILALNILQKLFSFASLDEETGLSISKWSSTATIETKIGIFEKDQPYIASYSVELAEQNGLLSISKESFSADFYDGKWRKYGASYAISDKSDLSFVFGGDTNLKNTAKSLLVEIAKSLGADRAKNRSVIFDKDLNAAIAQRKNADLIALEHAIDLVSLFAVSSFLVVDNRDRGLIEGVGLMPMRIRHEEKGQGQTGIIPLNLFAPNTVPEVALNRVKEAVDQFNVVVPAFLPGCRLGVEILDQKNREIDGQRTFELVSYVNGYQIPLRCESDGTKRIIAICNALFACYNDDAVVLCVDEFDAGIFEFLFGQIVDVMAKGASGQLVFTSHNLRPLEVLAPTSLILTTNDPDYRYEYFKGLKATNNPRDVYLREAFLNKEGNRFYKPTNEYEISKAFMKIGDIYHASDS